MKVATPRVVHGCALAAISMLAILLVGGPAMAQSTKPTTVPTTAPAALHSGKFEQTPLRKGEDPSTPALTPADTKVMRGLEPTRVALAVVIVIALIIVLRWFGRRFFPAAAVSRSSSAIRVLSRSVVAPRQQFLLLQVGRRVVVVGDCGTSMNALTEITDPEEIAALIGQIDAQRPESLTQAFGQFFGSARKQFDDEPGQEEEIEEPQLELAGGPAVRDDRGDDDLDVSSARGELRGLMDKVKLLSKQFHR